MRVLGPPGAGKTGLLIDRYRRLTAEAPDSAFVVTFSRGQLKLAMNHILPDGAAHLGPAPVYTHFMLAREILDAAGGRAPDIIEGLEESLLLERVVRRSAGDLRSDYRRILDSERLHRDLLATFHLFLQNGIAPEQLGKAPGVMLRDVARLFSEFVRELRQTNRATFYDISGYAMEACAKLPPDHHLRSAAVLLVDDFQDIDRAQFELLRTLASLDGGPVLNVFGDPLGAMFAFRGTDSRFLTERFEKTFGGDTFHLIRPDSDAGNTLDRIMSEILGDDGFRYAPSLPVDPRPAAGASGLGPLFDQAQPAAGDRVRVTVVEDEIEEVHAAALRVLELIGRDEPAPASIAVVTNQKSRYEPMLRAAFMQRGVPLETGRPLQGSFRGFVHALLQLLAAPDRHVALQAFVTSSFFPYFRMTAFDEDAATSNDASRVNERVRQTVSEHADLLRRSDTAGWMDHIFNEMLKPACREYRQATDDDAVYSFISILRERWTEYVGAITPAGDPPSLDVFVARSRLFRPESSAPLPADAEVGFYSCREIKGRAFDTVIVLGCSELIFPGATRRDTVVPAHELQSFLAERVPALDVRIYEARTPLEQLNEEYHLLYGSLARSRHVAVFAPESFAGQKYPAPAAILLGMDIVRRDDARKDRPPPVQYARTLSGAAEGAPEDLLPGELSPMGEMWNRPALPARPVTIEPFPLSKSSLESYLKCPRQFFYTKILRIQDDESGAIKVGKLFHEVMRRFAEKYDTQKALHDAVAEVEIRDAIAAAIAADGTVPDGTFLGASMRFHLFCMVKGALRIDLDQMEPYAVVSVEADMKYAHEGFDFRGKTDLVMRTHAGDHLLDYKTGEFNKKGDTLRKRTMDALECPDEANWQVPIYVWGYKTLEGGPPATFRHLVQGPGKDGYLVTLHIVNTGDDIPPIAVSNKKPNQSHSYLLESEIREIMESAVAFAAEMFSEREGFVRTDKLAHCRNCMFKRVCDRSVE